MALRIIVHIGSQSLGIDLKDGVYRLGRQKPADVVVADPTVSVNHAELQIRGDEWLVRDLGSTNGTFVNDVQVRAATRVREKDVLRCGSINIDFERPVTAAAVEEGPKAPHAGAVKIQQAKVAAGRLGWSLRYWIAGAEAILFLLILFFFIQIYSSSVMSKEWTSNRFRLFAEQYVHVLQEGTRGGVTTIPAPVLDDSLADPILVADRTGRILYPAGEAAPTPSPLIDPATKTVYRDAKFGLFVLPGTANAEGVSARSYPVRARGELHGFVVARPTNAGGADVGFALGLLLLSAVITLIVLFFALRPVHALVLSQLEALRTKISPLANGFIDSLPRSATFEKANEIASEIENAVNTARASGGRKAGAGKGGPEDELVPLVAELFTATGIPYCVVDQDFRAVVVGPDLRNIGELAGVTRDVSIFDAGLTSVQSKQLVQTIGDARRNRIAHSTLQLTRKGTLEPHAVTVEMFEHPKTAAQLFGIAFNPA